MHRFVINLDPVPWAAHKGFGKRAYNPRQGDRFEAQLMLNSQAPCNPIATAVKVNFVFYLPIPKSTPKKLREQMLAGKVHHVRKPDATNLQKFMEDVLKGVLIVDDSQVVEISSIKVWAEYGKTEIYLEEVS